MIFKKFKQGKKVSYTRYSKYRRGQEKRSILRKTKQGKTNRKRIIDFSGFKKIIIALMLTTALGGLIYYVYFTDNLVLSQTALFEGKERIDHDIILSEINAHKGEPILSVNAQELIAELKAKYPEIETIQVKKKLPNKLEVHITKYPIVSNLVVDVDGIKRTYLINSKGSIAVADSEDIALPFIHVSREKAYNSKDEVFNEQELSSILKAKNLFEQKFSMQIKEIRFLENAKEYHFLTENNFYIWMDLTQDYTAQLSKLKAAEQKLNIHTTDIQYIDLRIAGNNGEKVIYK